MKSKYRFKPDPLDPGDYWVAKRGQFGWICIVRQLAPEKWEAVWNGKKSRIRRTREEAIDDLLQALDEEGYQNGGGRK